MEYLSSTVTAEACRILLAERGTHFDPGVVDAFLARLTEIQAVVDRYPDD